MLYGSIVSEDPPRPESESDLLELAISAAIAVTAIVSDESSATPKLARSSQKRGTEAVSHASPARARSDARRSRRLTSSPKTKKSSPSDATCRSAPTSRARTSSARRVSCRSKPAAAAMSAALTRPPALRSTAASRGFGGSSERRSSSDIAGRAARRSSTACTGARLGRGRRARVGIATVRSIMAATRGVPPWRLDRPRKIRTALPCRLHSPARGRRACGCLACQRQQLRPRHRRVGVFLFPCWCPISSNKCPSLTVLHLPTTYLPTYPCGASGASPVPRRGSFVVKSFSPWPCCAPSIMHQVSSLSVSPPPARDRAVRAPRRRRPAPSGDRTRRR